MKKVYLALVILSLLLVVAAAPRAQSIPNPDELELYGVPWVLVGAVLIGLGMRYLGLTENGATLFAAIWAAAGYALVQFLPQLELELPWLPTFVPVILNAILIIGAQLGIVQLVRGGYRLYSALRR